MGRRRPPSPRAVKRARINDLLVPDAVGSQDASVAAAALQELMLLSRPDGAPCIHDATTAAAVVEATFRKEKMEKLLGVAKAAMEELAGLVKKPEELMAGLVKKPE